MTWLIGIDEAGYGPNLGPFVMTSVACRLPEDAASADLWALLRPAVRRPHEPADDRLLVEDSKVVYAAKDGLARLETGVLATVLCPAADGPFPLSDCVARLAPAAVAELAGEPWYAGTTLLPLAVALPDVLRTARLFGDTCGGAGTCWGLVRSVVVCPARFNGILDRWGSKGAVLGEALGELLRANLEMETGTEPLAFCIDKHGGRNTYAAMLQDAVPAGVVVAQEESAERSTYSVLGTGREVSLTFRPRADAGHFCVALASMVSKYLREVFMHEFNVFWLKQVPGLQPTAGYPGDARRFYEAIRPALGRLGISEERVWRRK